MENNNLITMKDVQDLINWIKDYFHLHPFLKGAIIGMSGGKDSLIVAKLLCEAIGHDKVFGVIMPNEEMPDIDDAIETCKLLNIKYDIINISNIYCESLEKVSSVLTKEEKQANSITIQNLPPRIRTSLLYGIGASLELIVANTSNLSETMIGYSTKWGDNVGDISPLANFTKTEVCSLGLLLGLPKHLVEKVPADGLSGKTDEDNLGITYDELDTFIRTGKTGANFEKIKKLHQNNQHKINGLIKYQTNRKNHFLIQGETNE